MIRIAIIGDIGSGKTFISKLFGYPTFNADEIVSKIYSKDKKTYYKLKKKLPNCLSNFPVKKDELIKAIIKNEKNIKIISTIIHPIVRRHLEQFLKKNKNNTVILDIPLFLENKLDKKKDKIIFIDSNRRDILKNIKIRKNYNKLVLKRLRKLQLPLYKKRRKSYFIIKNNFKVDLARKNVKNILRKILTWKR